jgi:hypothetical protein
MLRLNKVIKPWKESAALNDHINLYGFWNETTFNTPLSSTHPRTMLWTKRSTMSFRRTGTFRTF